MRMPRGLAITCAVFLGMVCASIGAFAGFAVQQLFDGNALPAEAPFAALELGLPLALIPACAQALRICWTEARRTTLRPLDLRGAAVFSAVLVAAPYLLVSAVAPSLRPAAGSIAIVEAALVAWAGIAAAAWIADLAFEARRGAAERRRVLVEPARLAAEQAKRPVAPRVTDKI